MEVSITKSTADGDESRVIIALAGSATIDGVETIKPALLAALVECGELVLDVSAITAADPALLQLIHAARSSALNAGISFVLAGEFSAVFCEAATSAGFMTADKK